MVRMIRMVGEERQEIKEGRIKKEEGLRDKFFELSIDNGHVPFFFKFIHNKLSKKLLFISSPLVIDYAQGKGIKTFEVENPNSKEFLNVLRELNPDVIINQSQSIIKEGLLQVPKIGVINRHNALLPKNRGRLTPFWVLYKGESETGVSIHFIDKEIDSGEIIVQKKYKVRNNDTFNSLVKRNYEIAGKAMLEALDILESGNYSLIPNDDGCATYNTTPDIKHAWKFRIRRLPWLNKSKSRFNRAGAD